MSDDNLPKATARGKTGDGRAPVDPPAAGARRAYKRKLGNYLIDKKLQLRYVAFVTLLSAVISGSLGYLIWAQKVRATDSVVQDFDPWIAKVETDWADQMAATTTDEERAEVKKMMDEDRASRVQTKEDARADMQKGDSRFILKLAGAGVGLVIVLSLFLVIMTHKVAGPLFKIGNYFEQMYEGRLGNTWPLRRFDMLKDFYAKFQEMHGAVRKRHKADNELVGRFLKACEDAGVSRQGALGHELDELATHHGKRDKALS